MSTPPIRPLPPQSLVDAAVHHLERGETDQALSYLERVWTRDNAYMHPDHGAVAYWYGTLLWDEGERKKARRVWTTSHTAVRAADRFDVPLADAYLRSLTPQSIRHHRAQAVEAYTMLIAHLGTAIPAHAVPIQRKVLAEIAPLLSDAMLSRIVTSEEDDLRDAPEAWTIRSEAGATLTAWWRRQDPFPGTPINERMEEHVARLVKARSSYACPATVSQLDDRGHVWIRFGEPYRDQEINFGDPTFIREVFRFGVPVDEHDFPDNEVWVYPGLSKVAGYYIFLEDRDCYWVGTSTDLIPSRLRQYRGTENRGDNIAFSGLMAMRYVYRELALQHAAFGIRYSRIANYAGWQETQGAFAEVGAETAQTKRVGAGATSRVVAEDPQFGIQPPGQFVPQVAQESRREDREMARARKKTMPRQYTALTEDVNLFPVALRTARFLTPDGKTRVEVYWGIHGETLRQDRDDVDAGALLSTSMVQYDDSFRPSGQIARQYVVPRERIQAGASFIAPPVAMQSRGRLRHIGLQWTQIDVDTDAGRRPDGSLKDVALLDRGDTQGMAIARVDSLGALRDAGPLEMSDVKLVMAPVDEYPTAQALETADRPYPFAGIAAGRPLLLYVEAYHLALDDAGRTRYTVSYEVEGRTRRGWSRLLRGQDEQRVATSTTTTGTSRRTQERILLDLSEIERSEDQDVRVTVRITDEVAGETVARAVSFILEGRLQDVSTTD